MLYNDDERLDVIFLLIGIDGIADGSTGDFSIDEFLIDTGALEAAVQGMRSSFPHVDGSEGASAFKKVANFMVHFIHQSPIRGVEFVNDIDQHYNFTSPFSKYDPNAVVALHIAIALLQNITICSKGGPEKKASRQIALSRHSYEDILSALSKLDVRPKEHFYLLAILLEQLVYKTNPECQYLDVVFGPPDYWDSLKPPSPPGQYDE